MILKPKILKNVKDVEYMDDFDDWYIFKENSSDYAELPKNMILYVHLELAKHITLSSMLLQSLRKSHYQIF